MPVTTIHVQYTSGSPARRHRVVLGFHSSGMTKPVYTNDSGEALVTHAAVGRATVYISGKAYHSFHAPGRTAVTLGRKTA